MLILIVNQTPAVKEIEHSVPARFSCVGCGEQRVADASVFANAAYHVEVGFELHHHFVVVEIALDVAQVEKRNSRLSGLRGENGFFESVAFKISFQRNFKLFGKLVVSVPFADDVHIASRRNGVVEKRIVVVPADKHVSVAILGSGERIAFACFH